MHERQTNRITSGVAGLDEILDGGFVDKRGYLIRGGPGTGKSTIGMHFLAAGVKEGQGTLYITLGENEEDLRANAENSGIDTKGIEFLDLSPDSDFRPSFAASLNI